VLVVAFGKYHRSYPDNLSIYFLPEREYATDCYWICNFYCNLTAFFLSRQEVLSLDF
jgi:hypothetical protein